MRFLTVKLLLLSFALAIFLLGPVSCIGLPSGADADEARTVRDELVKRYPFNAVRPPSTTDPEEDGIAVYWQPLSFRSNLDVYGISATDRQNQIVSILDDLRKAKHFKPIGVSFYSDVDSSAGNHLVRRIIISDPKPYDMKLTDFYFE